MNCDLNYWVDKGALIPAADGDYLWNICHRSWKYYFAGCWAPSLGLYPHPSYAEWIDIAEGIVASACNCTSHCRGKECGDDGCGGSCGNCPDGYLCIENQCVRRACVPQCQGKECGGDGCEGSCGDCPPHETCKDGTCACPNPCSGACCPSGDVCEEGSCCSPDCGGKNCGTDGCGGTCGECEEFGNECVNGQCECVADSTGSVYDNDYGCAWDEVKGECCGVQCERLEMYVERLNFIEELGVIVLSDTDRKDFFQAVAELECGQTAHWGDYQALDVAYLLWEDVVQVWLRRVAVSLRRDIDASHQEWQLGWSLQSMTEEQLQSLFALRCSFDLAGNVKRQIWPEDNKFGDKFKPGADFLFAGLPFQWWAPNVLGFVPETLWCCDPAAVQAIAKTIRTYALAHPEWYVPGSQYDALCSIVDYMRRELQWAEPGMKGDLMVFHSGEEWQSSYGGFNIEDVFAAGAGVLPVPGGVMTTHCSSGRSCGA